MKTRTGVPIRAEDLTADFVFGNVTCPIGRFDPGTYPDTSDEPWEKLGQEIMDQLVDSWFFTENELNVIASMESRQFLNCIIER